MATRTIEDALGMRRAEAVALWVLHGRPSIPLAPGVVCVDVDRLLRGSPDNGQLAAVRTWIDSVQTYDD